MAYQAQNTLHNVNVGLTLHHNNASLKDIWGDIFYDISTLAEKQYSIDAPDISDGIVCALISFFFVIFVATISMAIYWWIRRIKSNKKKGDIILQRGQKKFNNEEYGNARKLCNQALKLYTKARDEEKQNRCKNQIKECEKGIEELDQEISNLKKIMGQIEKEKGRLRTLIGCDPPCGMYELFLAEGSIIKSLFGANSSLIKAQKCIKNGIISEIRDESDVLIEKLKKLRGINSAYEYCKRGYSSYREVLNEILEHYGGLDLLYISRFCNVSQLDALFYLNFLIDENKKRCLKYNRLKLIQIKRKEGIVQIPPEMRAKTRPINDFERIRSEVGKFNNNRHKIKKKLEIGDIIGEKKERINFIRQYLKDNIGIKKIEILRRIMDISPEELKLLLNRLVRNEAKEKRYIVDWDEEKVVIDYFALKDHIRQESKNQKDVLKILKNGVNRCKIPDEIQERIISDLEEYEGEQNE
jgi:hypothetical protein